MSDVEAEENSTGRGSPSIGLGRVAESQRRSVAQLLNHSQWPRSLDCDELQGRIRLFLTESGANDADIANAFEEVDLPCANTADPAQMNEPSGEDEPMLLPKQTLQPNTRKAFSLFRDPFDELQCAPSQEYSGFRQKTIHRIQNCQSSGADRRMIIPQILV